MRAGALALVATAGVLLAASLLFGGGSSEGPVAWIGGAAVLAAAAAGCAALLGVLPVPAIGREGLACAGLATAFVGWNAVTILWSSAPDRSWGYFNRGLVYLAFGVVGAFVGSAVAPRIVAWLVGGLVTATCLWALAGKAIPALYEDYGRLARLRSPVGYWNALALVAAIGIPIALWAATRHSRRVRAGAVVALYALLVALVLTYSRGGILAALVAIAAWFALSRERFEGATAFLAAAVPAGLLLAVAIQLPGIAEDAQPRSVRVDDGAWFALLFVLGACFAFAAAYFVRYRPGPEREQLLLKAAAGSRRRVARGRLDRSACRGWQPVRQRPADRPGPEPADRGEPQQPVGLVEGGLGGLRGRAARWHGRRFVRASPSPAPAQRHRRARGAQPAAAVRFRDRSCRLPARRRRVRCRAARRLAGAREAGRRRAGCGYRARCGAADVSRPRRARLRLGLRRSLRAAVLHHRSSACDRADAAPAEAWVRLGRRRRARRVGGPLLDRGAAPGRCSRRRRLRAARARRRRAGGQDGEERALARPALDRSAPGVGRGRGGGRETSPGPASSTSRPSTSSR